MQISIKETFSDTLTPLPLPWLENLARTVSDVFCPPITMTLAHLVSASALGTLAGWLWAMFGLIFVIGAPVIYVFWQVHAGKISDFHIPIRSQRVRPMLLGIVCTITTLTLMWAGRAPTLLVSMYAWGVLMISVMLLITLRWKISGHTAGMTALALTLIHFLGPIMIGSLLLIPLVAWARVYIRRHTTAQTVAGACLGLLYIGLALLHQ